MDKYIIAGCIALVILILVWLVYEQNKISTSRYIINTDKVKTPVRIVLLADLHEKRYFNNQLKEAILSLRPDLLLSAGDMINKHSYNVYPFKDACPNVPLFCSIGNHEYNLFMRKGMEAFRDYPGVILDNEPRDILIKGNLISVFGITQIEPDQYILEYNRWKTDGYKILLGHMPFLAKIYKEQDLYLCGHTHGGQWRFFGRGVFAPNDGLFPKYTAGIHKIDGALTIISRGLGDHTHIPRINNPHELVIIDLMPETK